MSEARLCRFVPTFAVAVAMFMTFARAQCLGWLDGPERDVAGVGGGISASVAWDPDGAGPLPELLVVGGTFFGAGHSSAHNIAAWDGAQWSAMGALDGLVSALCVHHGELYAGGRFGYAAGSASPRGLAKWNGSTWEAVGGGLSGGTKVTGVVSIDDELCVLGDFTGAGATASSSIAAWNGSSWRQLGTSPPVAVRRLVKVAGTYYAGLPNVRALSGSTWTLLAAPGTGTTTDDLAATSFGLTAAASYDSGAGGGIRGNLYKWNGTAWVGASSLSYVGQALTIQQVGALVYVATSTSSVHSGTYPGNLYELQNNAVISTLVTWVGVYSVCGFRGSLFAGGTFTTLGGSPTSSAMLRTGGAWSALGNGIAGDVIASTEVGPTRYLITESRTSSTSVADYIWRKESTGWSQIAHGTGFTNPNGMKEIMGELWICSLYYNGVSGVQRFDGTAWHRVGAQLANVIGLIEYGGGVFAWTSSGVVYRFDGSQWSAFAPLGSARVSAAVLVGDSVLFGGYFPSLVSGSAYGVVKWDGFALSPVGSGLPGGVDHLAEADGAIWATLTSGTSRIWRFDGVAWSSVPQPGDTQSIRALASLEGRVYILGEFGTHSTLLALVWDGVVWEPMELEEYQYVLAGNQYGFIDAKPDHLTFGGAIGSAGGTAAHGLAVLGYNGCPADFNCDGGVDGGDERDFFASWENGEAQGDFNHDGGLDGADVAAFFTVWEGGC